MEFKHTLLSSKWDSMGEPVSVGLVTWVTGAAQGVSQGCVSPASPIAPHC